MRQDNGKLLSFLMLGIGLGVVLSDAISPVLDVVLRGAPLLLLLLAAPISWWRLMHIVPRMGPDPDACRTCGYCIKHNESGFCPECGMRIVWVEPVSIEAVFEKRAVRLLLAILFVLLVAATSLIPRLVTSLFVWSGT